jgi:hypothetical protein
MGLKARRIGGQTEGIGTTKTIGETHEYGEEAKIW